MRRKIQKRGRLVAILILTLLAGCGVSQEKNRDKIVSTRTAETMLRIGYWGSSGEEKSLEETVKGLEKEIDGIDGVELEQYPSTEEFYSKLALSAAAGSMPDAAIVTNEGLEERVATGIFEPLDGKINLQEYDTELINEWTVDGKLYGIPITAEPSCFIINTDMWKDAGLKEYPSTWEEVYNAAKILKEKGYTPLCLNLENPYHITQYMVSFGGGWNGGIDLDSPENETALKYMIKMYDEGLAVIPLEMGKSWDGEVFYSEECAMSTGGTWYTGAIRENEPDLSYEMIPLPGNGESTLHSYGYVVMADAENKDVALNAIPYLTGENAQRIRMTYVGDIPVMQSLKKEYFEKYPELEFMETSLKSAKGFDYPKDGDITAQVLERLRQRVMDRGSNLTVHDILDCR